MRIEIKKYATDTKTKPQDELPATIVSYLNDITEPVILAFTHFDLPTAKKSSTQTLLDRLRPSKSSTTVTTNESCEFDHTLIKTGPNQWNIIESTRIGAGSFGKVHQSLWKIVIDGTKAHIVPTDEVVKIQDLPVDEEEQNLKAQGWQVVPPPKPPADGNRAQIIREINNEYQGLRANNLDVKPPIIAAQKIYLVMPNCGPSLDKYMPARTQFNFDESFDMAYGILNDMNSLRNQGIIHRDLKPANICRKEVISTKTRAYHYIFIDFGLSVSKEPKDQAESIGAGTLLYMAPELLDGPASYASEIYALAGIFLQIFGANALKDKNYQFNTDKNDTQRVLDTTYSNEGLFGDGLDPARVQIPANVDEQLLLDIRNLFKTMANPDPNQRPTIDTIIKFFSGITYRRVWNDTYDALYTKIEQLSSQLGIETYLPRPIISHLRAINAMQPGERINALYPSTDLQKIKRTIDGLDLAYTHKTRLQTQYDRSMSELNMLNTELGVNYTFKKPKLLITKEDLDKLINNEILAIKLFPDDNSKEIDNHIAALKTISAYKKQLTADTNTLFTELNALHQELYKTAALKPVELIVKKEEINRFIAGTANIKDLFPTDNRATMQAAIDTLKEIKAISALLAGKMTITDPNHDLFQGTNSSTIRNMQQILVNDDLSPVQKLIRIQELAQQKITPGLANRYSHSRLFGKGRHENINRLYAVLAKITIPDLNHVNTQTPATLAAVKNELETIFSTSSTFVAQR